MKPVRIVKVEQPTDLAPQGYNAADDLLARNLSAGRASKTAFIDDAGTYTFAEFAERVARCANSLLASAIAPQQRIVLCLLDTIDFPAVFLGAIKAGIVPIPLNTMLQPAEYAHVLNDSGATAALVSDALLPCIQEAANLAGWRGKIIVSGETQTQFPSLYDLMRSADDNAATVLSSPDDVCFWLYSSGSTGKPKGAVHKQISMIRTAELFAQQVLGLRANDVVYSAAKLFFAYGLGNALSFPLAIGVTSVLYSGRANAQAVCEVLRKHRPTIFCGVPTLFSALLACDALPRREELSLRLCVSAGEALPEGVGRGWAQRTGVEIVDGIGSTEMLHIFISNRPGHCRYGTTGALVPGYKARLMDEDGREAARGVMGDLYVSGPSAAAYYWNDLERTKNIFVGEWVKTGDRFRINSDGDYVYCGRSDEMLKVGGIWVSPTEVESALMAHQAVLEAAVVGVADEKELIKPKAFVVLKPSVGRSSELDTELKNFVKSRLAPYKCPRWIEFRDELPKTATGKIRRNVLRQQAAASREKSQGA
jgi:benzoate-CoA ligase